MATTSTPDTSTGMRRSLSAADNHSGVTSPGYRGIDTTALITSTPPLLRQSTDRSTVRHTARAAVNGRALVSRDVPLRGLVLPPPEFVETSTRGDVRQCFPTACHRASAR